MKLYWKPPGAGPNGPTYVAEDVPSNAVSFAVFAPCPCGEGVIHAIDHIAREWWCSPTDQRSTQHHKRNWPEHIVRVQGTFLHVENTNTGLVAVYPGKVHKP